MFLHFVSKNITLIIELTVKGSFFLDVFLGGTGHMLYFVAISRGEMSLFWIYSNNK